MASFIQSLGSAHNAAAASAINLSAAASASGNTIIVLGTTWGTNTPSAFTVSDSQGLVWSTVVVAQRSSSVLSASVAWARSNGSATTITGTWGSTTGRQAITAIEVSGLALSPVDVLAQSSNASGVNVTGATATTSQASGIAVACWAIGGVAAESGTSGSNTGTATGGTVTEYWDDLTGSSNWLFSYGEYQVLSAAGTVNLNYTPATNATSIGTVVVFKEDVGGAPSPSKLRYSPPPLVSPQTLVLPAGTGFSGPTYDTSTDVIVTWPSTARNGANSVTGGRNVRTIGGYHLFNQSQSAANRFQAPSGSVFAEGLLIDVTGGTHSGCDALDAYGDSSAPFVNIPDVYLQNIRMTGVHGASTSTSHSDMFQPQGAIRNLYVDKFTGDSDYQGFFIVSLLGRELNSATFSRMNLKYNGPAEVGTKTFLIWLYDATTGICTTTTFSEVYIEPRAGQTLFDCVWPPPGTLSPAGVDVGAVTDDGGLSIYWPLLPITGRVKLGPPPGGDFVPAASVGAGYVSPGYYSHYSVRGVTASS